MQPTVAPLMKGVMRHYAADSTDSFGSFYDQYGAWSRRL
jgi:hypothetical protein